MKWEEVCKAFLEQWILIEVIQAYTNEESERMLEEVAPLKKFPNSSDAMKAYQQLHQENPKREMYVLHTSRKDPNIIKKNGWVCQASMKRLRMGYCGARMVHRNIVHRLSFGDAHFQK